MSVGTLYTAAKHNWSCYKNMQQFEIFSGQANSCTKYDQKFMKKYM